MITYDDIYTVEHMLYRATKASAICTDKTSTISSTTAHAQ